MGHLGRKDFVFEDHVLRVDDPSEEIERIEGLLRKRRSYGRRWALRLRLEWLRSFKRRSYDRYDGIRDFFAAMSDNPNNQVEYEPIGRYRVSISGESDEPVIFRASGNPFFGRSDDGTEATRLPVTIGADKRAILEMYRHPDAEIGPLTDYAVEYRFETGFPLGGKYDKFTKNQRKLSRGGERVYCGEPGRVYFRDGDALDMELGKSVYPILMRSETCEPIDERGRLKLCGRVRLKNTGELVYQGDFEAYNTSFPFFVREDRNRGGGRRSAEPVVGASA